MDAPKRIVVAGATGRVGRHIVDVLTERGQEVVPASRATGVDVVTGAGLEAAVAGADVIIDATTPPSRDRDTATAFFTTAAANLQRVGTAAGVGRIIVVSIIGTDRFTTGYSAAKRDHEEALGAGPVPVHVLRSCVFHEFVEQFVQWMTVDDVARIPNMRTQLVAARTVADALADLAAEGRDAGAGLSEVAGPRPEELVDMARLLVSRRGLPLKVEGVSDESNPDHVLFENGTLLPGPGARLGGPTFEEWLDTST
jgi:uncharacterized protein YbjT (DUF2867 family)